MTIQFLKCNFLASKLRVEKYYLPMQKMHRDSCCNQNETVRPFPDKSLMTRSGKNGKGVITF